MFTVKNMAEDNHLRICRVKTYQPRNNVVNMYSDAELIKRYRLDRAGIIYITELVREYIESPTGRSISITPKIIVL